MRIAYRPEIDGLRALSVFAVILYHAKFFLFDYTLFEGGFIGVDIFFIISGYLITNIILNEIFKTNQFSFKYFYERRIRRILPVLLFVTIITSIISYFILLPYSLIDFGKSVLNILFSSNFYFHYTVNVYGEENSLLKPLLHTWSLSVEEQFYVLFPIFLIIAIKYFKKYLFIFLSLCLLIGLIFSQYFSRTHPSFNFYMLPSRGFEFLIGALLSCLELSNEKSSRKSYPLLNKICPGIGIILIFFSLLFFDFTKIFHPSVITLIPLTGVSLIIWFSKKGELITEILSSKIFVFFGIISYSLYLWHYPIFAFLRYIDAFDKSAQIKLLAIFLTIILSILSYYFIEKPFRKKSIVTTRTLTTYSLVSVIILLSYSFYTLKTEGIKNRLPNIISEKLTENVPENKLNKVKGNLNNIFLIGDSHSDSLKYHLNKELTKKSYNFYKQDTLLYLNNFNQINRKNNTIVKDYVENNEKIQKFLQEHKNLIVVWHQRWSPRLLEELFDNMEGHSEYMNEQDRWVDFYFQPTNIKTETLEQRQKYITESIKLSAKNILQNQHILILVYPVPEIGFHVPKLVIQNKAFFYLLNNKIEIPILSVSYDVFKNRNKIIFETLDSIKGPNVYRVFPHKSFCNTVIINRCVTNNKEHLFYYDDDHLSLEGSKYIVNDIMKAIQQIEVNKKISR